MKLSLIGTACAVVLTSALAVPLAPTATAVGPGGWDHVGTGATATSRSLNNDVLAMSTDIAGKLLVAGKFTDAGGVAGRNRIASWDGSTWSSVGPANTFGSDIYALAVDPATNRVFAGGSFQDAGGNTDSDFLAVWDGTSWAPFCVGAGSTRLTANVKALQVMGGSLYVGGEFQDGFGVSAADYLLRCDLTTGDVSATTTVTSFPGPVYALAADGTGRLFAGGSFQNVENNPASDFVAQFTTVGGWINLGSGGGVTGGAVTAIVRSLDASSTDLFVGTEGVDIAGLAKADHIAGWNGTSWYALGGNAAGTDGYIPGGGSVYSVLVSGTHVIASGDWANANGNPLADHVAEFDGAAWQTLGSNVAGNGSLNAKSEALAYFGTSLFAGGNFTSAGGDAQAQFIARYVPGYTPPVPSNAVKLGKVKLDKKKGTALLSVKVLSAGQLEVLGRGVKPWKLTVAAAGKFDLKVKPTSETKQKLKKKGSAKVKVKVRFTPTGGTPHTEKITIVLVLKPKPS